MLPRAGVPHIAVVVGTRPEIVKLAPVVRMLWLAAGGHGLVVAIDRLRAIPPVDHRTFSDWPASPG